MMYDVPNPSFVSEAAQLEMTCDGLGYVADRDECAMATDQSKWKNAFMMYFFMGHSLGYSRKRAVADEIGEFARAYARKQGQWARYALSAPAEVKAAADEEYVECAHKARALCFDRFGLSGGISGDVIVAVACARQSFFESDWGKATYEESLTDRTGVSTGLAYGYALGLCKAIQETWIKCRQEGYEPAISG